MYCGECGTAIQGAGRFCVACGKPVNLGGAPAAAVHSSLAAGAAATPPPPPPAPPAPVYASWVGSSGRSGSERFVVVDVETTGVYDLDRVVEVAAVTLSPDGEIVDEWDSLVDPERDVGPTHLHGITASMVSAAPRFEEVAFALGTRVHGAVLVAHNLAFDSRMLRNEYSLLGANLACGRGICTLSLSGERLEVACARYGIEIERHHRALADARATARLLGAVKRSGTYIEPAALEGLTSEVCPRTLRRELVTRDQPEMPYLSRLALRTQHRGSREAALLYLDMLDWAMSDCELSPRERAELISLACELGMTPESVRDAHEQYMRELIAAAARDQRITSGEREMLNRAATALGLGTGLVDEAMQLWHQPLRRVRISAGMAVCFTGQATYSDGSEMEREILCRLADSLGLRVEESVTKKRCDLLVASDPSSQSTKTRKARGYGIPVLAVKDFLCAEPGREVIAN